MTGMREIIEYVQSGRDLDRATARTVFGGIMAGEMPADWLGAFLCALATKGESVAEIVGAASALRDAVVRIRCDAPCVDTCGTGGDGVSTFNVSTTAAIVAAAAGAVIAKHGNRTNTRVSGSAEVLRELGVNIEASVPTIERCLREVGMAFLFAPGLHPAMRHAMPARRAIRRRTIFNLVGPLTNPAGATRQVLGVSKPAHVPLMAEALAELGADHAWIVHGADGLCDLSITGPTQVAEVRSGIGGVRQFVVSPEEVGLPQAPLATLLVDSPAASAAAVRGVLAGERGPRRDHTLLNAAAALVVAEIASDLREGAARAADAIDSGAAVAKLAALAACSNEAAA
jgi:anthranilate phosphoribosyltransferase